MTPTVMKRGRTTWRVGAGALLLGSLGCSASDEPCSTGEPCELEGQVEVATWWGTRSELYVPFDILREGLKRTTNLEAKLAHRFETKDRHTTWVEQQLVPDGADPLPLDVFSANNGDEVLRWTACAASETRPPTRLRGLTRPELGISAFDADWIKAHFPPEVMDTLQCEGETYALPVGIHRINTLLYNKSLFRLAGYAVDGSGGTPLPRTLDELHVAAEALKAQLLVDPTGGSDLAPSVFAVAGREAWTLSLFVIENLMLSLANDAEHYRRYWRGDDCDESLLGRALDEFARLEPYFGNTAFFASDARNRVITGQAAMMVIGDWAAAEAAPEDVGTMPFPGTERYFVFSADVFALPDIPSADPGKGLAWLRAVTAESTQREFSVAKNALAARTELEGELAPDGPNAPEWVRSLPAFLPYGADSAFNALQGQLQLLLDGKESAVSLRDYARQEYLKLSHGTVSCTPDIIQPGDPIQ